MFPIFWQIEALHVIALTILIAAEISSGKPDED
jgi:hypothetical protein